MSKIQQWYMDVDRERDQTQHNSTTRTQRETNKTWLRHQLIDLLNSIKDKKKNTHKTY